MTGGMGGGWGGQGLGDAEQGPELFGSVNGGPGWGWASQERKKRVEV